MARVLVGYYSAARVISYEGEQFGKLRIFEADLALFWAAFRAPLRS